jgi:transposase-like protein
VNVTTTELDELIEQKRWELQDLLFARYALGCQLGVHAPPAPKPRLAAPELRVPDGIVQSIEPFKEDPDAEPPTRADRRQTIAELALKKMRAGIDGMEPEAPKKYRQRRTHSVETKLAALKELDGGASISSVAAKYDVTPTLFKSWREKRDAGALVAPDPSAVFVEDGVIDQPEEAPSPEVASEDLDLVHVLGDEEDTPASPFDEADEVEAG